MHSITNRQISRAPFYSKTQERPCLRCKKASDLAIECIKAVPILGCALSLCANFVAKCISSCFRDKRAKVPVNAFPVNTIQVNALQINALKPLIPKETCSFSWEHISFLNQARLGLRHVSSSAHAQREIATGMQSGCSFSLQPRYAQFKSDYPSAEEVYQLDQFSQDAQKHFLRDFEAGVNEALMNSLIMDLGDFGMGRSKVIDLLKVCHRCFFLLVSYDFDVPRDQMLWGRGLGRFAKLDRPADKIFYLPLFVDTRMNLIPLDEIALQLGINGDLNTIIDSKEFERIMNKLIDFYRSALILTLNNRISTY